MVNFLLNQRIGAKLITFRQCGLLGLACFVACQGSYACLYICMAFTHDKIFSKMNMAKYGLASDLTYTFYATMEESFLNILRECIIAKQVWASLVPSHQLEKFFKVEYSDWVSSNLSIHSYKWKGVCWTTVFLMTWRLWKWWNDFCLNNSCPPFNTINWLHAKVFETGNAFKIDTINKGTRNDTLVSWSLPSNRCFKLNSDGSSRKNPASASCGGFI